MLDKYWACAWMLALWDEYPWTMPEIGGVCPVMIFASGNPPTVTGCKNLGRLGWSGNPHDLHCAHDFRGPAELRRLIKEVAAS